jgi:hypothetical protein
MTQKSLASDNLHLISKQLVRLMLGLLCTFGTWHPSMELTLFRFGSQLPPYLAISFPVDPSAFLGSFRFRPFSVQLPRLSQIATPVSAQVCSPSGFRCRLSPTPSNPPLTQRYTDSRYYIIWEASSTSTTWRQGPFEIRRHRPENPVVKIVEDGCNDRED